MAFRTRAKEAAAAAAAMLTPKKLFRGGGDAGAELDIAPPPLSTAPQARMSITHAEQTGEIMQQLRIIQEGQQRMDERLEEQRIMQKGMQEEQQAGMQQLRIMQEERQVDVEKLQQHMDEQMHSMQDSVTRWLKTCSSAGLRSRGTLHQH
jgi:hypothetical protein